MTTTELELLFNEGDVALAEDGIGYRVYAVHFDNKGYDKVSYAVEIDVNDGYTVYNIKNGEPDTKAKSYPYEVGEIARALQRELHGARV